MWRDALLLGVGASVGAIVTGAVLAGGWTVLRLWAARPRRTGGRPC